MSEAIMASAAVSAIPRPPQQEIDEMRLRKMDMSTIEWAVHLAKFGPTEQKLIKRYTFRTPTKTQAARKAKMQKIYKKSYYANKRAGKARKRVGGFLKKYYKKYTKKRKYSKK